MIPLPYRIFNRAVGAGFAATNLAGCMGGGGGNGSTTLRYLGWGGNTQQAAETAFGYWEEETGNTVEHQLAGGDSEFLSNSGEPGRYRLFMPSSFGVYTAREEGLLTDFNYDALPSYQEISRVSGPTDPISRTMLSWGMR